MHFFRHKKIIQSFHLFHLLKRKFSTATVAVSSVVPMVPLTSGIINKEPSGRVKVSLKLDHVSRKNAVMATAFVKSMTRGK